MSARHGFTVVEMVIALVSAAVILAGSWSLLASVGEARGVIANWRSRSMNRYEAYITVRDALLAADRRAAFSGTATGTKLVSRCPTGRGYALSCEVELRITQSQRSCMLVLESPYALTQRAVPTDGPCFMRYLLTADNGGEWAGTWSRDASLPLALGMVLGPDTLHFRIGQ